MVDKRDAEADTPAQQHSPGAIQSRAEGASIVMVETLGRNGVFALWFSSFIAAGALIAVIAMCFWIDRLSARVYVMEYDTAQIRAQLIEKEIIERTGH